MEKKRIEIIITSVLIVIFILAWANSIKILKKRTKKTAQGALTAISMQTETPVQKAQQKEDFQDLDWLRCPFSGKIYSGKESSLTELELIGVIWDEKAPVAMINERIVKVGDRIQGNTVIAIKQDRVILNDGKNDFELIVGR